MPFSIIRGDITRIGAEAVVNAANTSLAAGGGVCGAIFAAAGHADLQAACDRIGHCDTGDAAVTPGFALSRWIIHAVGPVWRGGRENEEYLLRGAYCSALEKAVSVGAQSVAFPLISSGIYGYPAETVWAALLSKFPASAINAVAAMIAAPILYTALRPALNAIGVVERLRPRK